MSNTINNATEQQSQGNVARASSASALSSTATASFFASAVSSTSVTTTSISTTTTETTAASQDEEPIDLLTVPSFISTMEQGLEFCKKAAAPLVSRVQAYLVTIEKAQQSAIIEQLVREFAGLEYSLESGSDDAILASYLRSHFKDQLDAKAEDRIMCTLDFPTISEMQLLPKVLPDYFAKYHCISSLTALNQDNNLGVKTVFGMLDIFDV